MWVVFEGIHDVGKTTLIDSVCKKIHFHQFNCRRAIPQLSKSKNIDISNFSLGANCSIVWFSKFADITDVVFDRLHLSEYAYSQVMRNFSHREALKRFRIIDEKLAESNTKLIYLHNDISVILNRAKQRNKSFNLKETIRLFRHLNNAFNNSKVNKLILHTNENVDILTDKVIKFIDADIPTIW